MNGEEAAGPASNLMMVVGILILLSAVSSGWISDRIGTKRLVALSGITATVGSGLIILAQNMREIYIGGCIIGIATGMFFTSNWALGTTVVPKKEAGQYLGIANLAGAGAGAIGGYIGGPIADFFTVHVPSYSGLGYLLLFAMYGVLFALSSMSLVKVNEKQTVPA
jgi:MFS family permease